VIEDIRREHVMNAFRAACAIALSFLPAVAGASDTDWRRYVLPKSGAAVEVPVTIFGKQAELPEGGLGWRFTTGDGRADLTVQALPNSANDSPAMFLAKMRPPPGILYEHVTPNFFVVSSIWNDRIWYNRCNRASDGGPVRTGRLHELHPDQLPGCGKKAVGWDRDADQPLTGSA
jgi:hypothetical protein